MVPGLTIDLTLRNDFFCFLGHLSYVDKENNKILSFTQEQVKDELQSLGGSHMPIYSQFTTCYVYGDRIAESVKVKVNPRCKALDFQTFYEWLKEQRRLKKEAAAVEAKRNSEFSLRNVLRVLGMVVLFTVAIIAVFYGFFIVLALMIIFPPVAKGVLKTLFR